MTVLNVGPGLNVEPAVVTAADQPQFDHAIQSWAVVAMVSMVALMVLAFYIYGQFAPGA